MTWNIAAQVNLVRYDGEDDVTTISASALKGQTYESQWCTGYDEDKKPIMEARSIPRLNSNTEGEIESIDIVFTVKGEATGVEVGDTITAYGHFQTTPKADA